MVEEKLRRIAARMRALVHECDAGMKQGVVYYRNAIAARDRAIAAGDSALAAQLDIEATALLKRAARLPYQREARIQAMITTYTAATLNAALAQLGAIRLSDLATELAPLKTYSDGLSVAYQGGATLEQIAQDIETNRASIDVDESVPIPVGYEDIL